MLHFLQRPAWANLQKSLGRTAVSDSGDGWQYQAFIERGKLGTRLYCPYGPVASSPESLEAAIHSLKQNAKKLGAAYIRVEPTGNLSQSDLPALGLLPAPEKQPLHTQRIDIDRPFTEVLADMRKSLRNAHRNYTKKSLSVRSSNNPNDVEHLIKLMSQVTDRTGMMPHSDEYLRANAHSLMPDNAATIYLAEFENKVVAAALIFDDEDCRYYAHAAADTEHRSLQPGSVIVTQMIEDAANGPQKFFDLYGVVPVEETEHPWFGFSQFKRSFGGSQFDYNGTWDIPVSKPRYQIVKLARKLFKDKF